MRRHDARKWLHAILDLLPVILIPVFMIYSHRHNPVTNTELNIEYKYQSNEVNSLDDLVVENLYYLPRLYIGLDAIDDGGVQSSFNRFYLTVIKFDIEQFLDSYEFNAEEYYYEDRNFNGFYINVEVNFDINNSSHNESYLQVSTEFDTLCFTYEGTEFYSNLYDLYFIVPEVYGTNNLNNFKNYWNRVNDVGNENIVLPQYTDYNEIVRAELVGGETDTITDVFVNNFNSTVNTYFNMGNVFGLNGVYEWFNTNIFGGNAPTIIYSVWNIALYELLMDLLMLLYALFMWFIDFCQDLIDRCFTTSKGGKH